MDTLRRATSQPYLLLTLTPFLWAGNAIAGKLAVGHISPFLLTSIRWALALWVLLIVAAPMLRRDWRVIRRHLPFLALLGTMGFTLFNSLFYLGLTHTTALHASIEQAAMPLVVFVLNFLIYHIRMTWLQVVGYLLTLVGVILTVTNGNPFAVTGQHLNIGDGYMMIAVFAYGLYSVLLVHKPAMHWLSFITVLASFAFISSIPGAIVEIQLGKAIWPDARGWAVSAYVAIFPSILAQVMWIRGLEIIGSNRGGVFMNLVPIFAAGMAVLLLGEAFRPYHAVAMALVISGVWMAQKKAAR